MLLVGFMGGIGDEVVTYGSPLDVVAIVDAGGGGPTVVEGGASLEVEFEGLESSVKTMLGEYGWLTMMAA